MREPVHVICAADADYFMPMSVTLVSLVEHFDPERDLVIHIINSDGIAQQREKVRASIAMNRPGLEHIEIHWHSIDSSLLENLQVPKDSHFTKDIYARIFAPALVPETCERAVYLDCDMVVLADISVPYDAAANDKTVLHAVRDVGIPQVSSKEGLANYKEMGIPSDAPYFNSGFLIINLKLWRERNLTSALIDYLKRRGADLIFPDQEALNALLYRDWTPLDTRWNEGTHILHYKEWAASGYSKEEWLRHKKDPYIVHFTGPKKPWLKGRRAPRYSYFFKYLQKTAYKNGVPHRPYLESIIGLSAYYLLWKWFCQLSGRIKLV